MQCKVDDDKRILELIKNRMVEGGISEVEIGDQDIRLGQLIRKGLRGYPVKIETDDLYRITQLLGLVSHRCPSGQIPSREELITLLEFGEISNRQKHFVDWGC